MDDLRLPPYSADAERALLGGLLLDGSAFPDVNPYLTPGSFYLKPHKAIYESMSALSLDGVAIDYLTVKNHLEGHGALDNANGAEYIAELTSSVATSANVVEYAKIIEKHSFTRKSINASQRMIQKLFDEPDDPRAIVTDQAQKFMEFARDRKDEDANFPTLLMDSFTGLLDYKKYLATLTQTGFESFDSMFHGFGPGTLNVLGGSSSMGKTALAINMATNIARSGKSVYFASLEMSKGELATRILTSEARVPVGTMRSGNYNDSHTRRLSNAYDQLSGLDIRIKEPKSEEGAVISDIYAESGIDIVFIDYLQLIASEDDYGTRDLAIGSITKRLRAVAKDLKIPIVLLSQLNSKEIERRAAKKRRPVMSDLRDSSATANNADMVMFVYREKYYDEEAGPEAELIVRKNRTGKTGTVKLVFRPEYTRFDPL